jgi:hypothetical protein
MQEAPTSANRGKATRAQAGSSVEGGKVVPDKGTAKKKRGRPSTTGVKEQVPNPATSKAENRAVPKRRGRHVKMEGPAEAPGEDRPVPKKRGRPSISRAEEQVTVEAPAGTQSNKVSRRGRPSNRQGELEAVHESVTKDQDHPERETRKRRTRQSDAAEISATVSPVMEADRSITRGRRSGTVLEVQTATSFFGKARKGRKNRKDTAANDEDGVHGTAEATTKKRRKAAGTEILEMANPKDQGRRIERRAQNPTQEEEEEPIQTDEPPSYQHLAEVIHRVSRQTIQAKWEPLPPSCIERVSDLLHDIQRPVVQRLGDERKRTQASTALEMVSRRLINKISKGRLPFPPSSGHRREDDLDFEKILDQSRDLESQLTLTLHANRLLESELSKETAQLEAEEDALAQLETNAKTEASRRKEAGRKLHSLLQSENLGATDEGLKDEMGLAMGPHDAPLSLVILPPTCLCAFTANIVQEDEDLQGIVEKLNGHVDSIQGNIKQVQGISEAMVKSKAAVQASLFNHLERTQYEDVVLG